MVCKHVPHAASLFCQRGKMEFYFVLTPVVNDVTMDILILSFSVFFFFVIGSQRWTRRRRKGRNGRSLVLRPACKLYLVLQFSLETCFLCLPDYLQIDGPPGPPGPVGPAVSQHFIEVLMIVPTGQMFYSPWNQKVSRLETVAECPPLSSLPLVLFFRLLFGLVSFDSLSGCCIGNIKPMQTWKSTVDTVAGMALHFLGNSSLV